MLTAGIHFIDAETYHSDPCPAPSLSSTLAKELLGKSPRHAWTASPRLNPNWGPHDSKTFDIGRAAHRAVLGRGGDYVTIPEAVLASNGAASTKEAKAFIEDARAQGLTPIKASEAEAVEAMKASILTKLFLMRIPEFTPDRSEVTAIAEIDGIWCRAMIDHAPSDPRLPLYDLKTCTDASPEAVVKAVATYRYDVQAAHYLDVWQAATGERRKFRFVFVEKDPPFEVAVVELYEKPGDEADWFDHARADISDARRVWGQCLNSDHWPGYPARVAVVGAPGWHTAKLEAKAALRTTAPKPAAKAVADAAAWQAP